VKLKVGKKKLDFVLMLGGTGVVIGGIWGFYQALRLLFGF
jgi:hypothetical protein